MKGKGKYTKGSDGKYHIGGKTYDYLVGSRRQVFNGSAFGTTHGRKRLTKADLMQNRWGRIVSRRLHNRAKREDRVGEHVWGARKGKFGAVRKTKSVKRSKSRSKSRSRSRSARGTRKKCRTARGRFKKC